MATRPLRTFQHPETPRAFRPQFSRPTPSAAFTLVEMVLSLMILSVLSLGVAFLTFGAMNGDRYLRSAHTSQSEVDLAMRRIQNNLREAQDNSITVGANTLSTLTQADTANGYPNGATVTYALQTDPSAPGQKMLVETDQRYGANTLVHNVTTFTVAAVSGMNSLYQVDIVASGKMTAERHFRVYARN